MEKISAVYKIVNTITGECYVGSSKDVKKRWAYHKCPSQWKQFSNKLLYKDFQKYGLDYFRFQIMCPVMPEYLKDVEQELIEMIQPAYNSINAKGWNTEQYKEWYKKYEHSEKGHDVRRKALKKYCQSDKGKETRKKYHKEYCQTEKGHEVSRKASRKYLQRICLYNGETLTFNALRKRFHKTGIEHPTQEAKKYLIH